MKAEAELYARGSSPLHAWDPRWKVVALSLLAFVSSSLDTPWAALSGVVVALGWLIMARLPWRLVGARLAVAQVLLLPCVLILPFSFDGESRSVGPLVLSQEGMRWAILFYLRALAILTLGIALVYTTPMVSLLRALQSLRVPRVLVEIALLTYRYLFTLAAEGMRMRWALAARGFGARRAPQTYRPLANGIGMALVRSVERTERIQQAMVCRGFQGRLHTLQRFRAGPTDWLKLIACLALAAGLAALDRGWLSG